MDEYTPTTTQIRDGYSLRGWTDEPEISGEKGWQAQDRHDAEFDRWLEAHDRQIAAKALGDAADEFEGGIEHEDLKHHTEQAPKGWTDESINDAIQSSGPIMDWLRARAESIATETEADRG